MIVSFGKIDGKKYSNTGTIPVDDGNSEKGLDILVEHPQLVKKSKNSWKIKKFVKN